MSMHVSMAWKVGAISGVDIDCVLGWVSRGMLAGSPHGTASGPRGGTEDRPGGDHIPPTSSTGRRGTGWEAGGAGPSRPRGAGSRAG